MTTVRLIIALFFLLAGQFVFICSAIGVNRFTKALNRMHAAALGDTMGLLCIILSLVIWRGLAFVTWKLLAVVAFFWLGSPVASHMMARLEAETNDDLGEIEVEHR